MATSKLDNITSLALHLGAGASDGYLTSSYFIYDETKGQDLQKTLDNIATVAGDASNYQVNGKKIGDNPTLTGADINVTYTGTTGTSSTGTMNDALSSIVSYVTTKVDNVQSSLTDATSSTSGLMSSDDKSKLDAIESGAEANVIETVKVNGTALTVTDKAVDINLSGKVDKEDGKGLSTEDFTTDLKTKLEGITDGATKVTIDSTLDSTSENPVQNKVIKAALDEITSSVDSKDSDDITVGTDYSKPASSSAITSTDSVSDAIGKLEAGVSEAKSAASSAATAAGTSITDTAGNFDATTVEDALSELASDIKDASTASTVTVTSSTPTSDEYAAAYTIAQNGKTVGTINIPKDFFVKDISVEECTVADQPKSGLSVGDKYIDLEVNIANGSATSKHVYLACNDIITPYTTEQNATEVQLSISTGNVISATLSDSVKTSLGKADSAVQSITVGTTNGTISVDGTEVKVAGLGSAAYTDSSAYDAAGAADDVKSAIDAYTINGKKISETPVLTGADIATSSTDATKLSETISTLKSDTQAKLVAGDHIKIGTDNTISAYYSVATDTTDGLMSSEEHKQLAGLVSTGGEVNQNAFSNVKVGSTTIAATDKTDTVEFASGNDALTISGSDKTVTFSLDSTKLANDAKLKFAIGTGSSATDAFSANASTDATVTIPTASDTAYGVIKTGFTETGSSYAVKVDSTGKAFVDVPWTDTGITSVKSGTGTGNAITSFSVSGRELTLDKTVTFATEEALKKVAVAQNVTDGETIATFTNSEGTETAIKNNMVAITTDEIDALLK